jgi:hypothetical protein
MTRNWNLPPGTLASQIDPPNQCPHCEGEGCDKCAGLGLADEETTRPKRSGYTGYRNPFQGRKSI